MKKRLKKIINIFLDKFGLEIVRKHEKIFLSTKYQALIEEMQIFFCEVMSEFRLKRSKRRIKLMMELNGTQISEAFYILMYLNKSIKVKGDVCEFGIANGTTSALLANEIINVKKNLWLFDSFKGLSRPGKKDILINDISKLGSISKYEGSMNYSQQDVDFRLKNISFPKSKAKIIAGFISDTVSDVKIKDGICFAYIDFDLYDPTKIALDFLDKNINKKGHIVIDDYGFFTSGPKTAVDEFMKKRAESYKVYYPYKFAGHFCILEKI